MASRFNQGSPTRADPFTGLKFWLSHQVPMKSYYKDRLLERGAIIVAKEALADICLVDDARKNPPTGDGYYSYKFVDESIKRNALANLEDHVVGIKSRADRQVGSVTVAAKGRRNPFTKEDDQILFNWLEPIRHTGGKWKGNEVYKQLEREHPQHTFQSWRNRYINLVEQGVKISITTPVDIASRSDHEDIEMSQIRSPKRRRLNGTESVTTPKRAHPLPAPLHRSVLKSSPKQSIAGFRADDNVKEVDGVEALPTPVTDQLAGTDRCQNAVNTDDSLEPRNPQSENVAREAVEALQHQTDGQSEKGHATVVANNQQFNTGSNSVLSPPRHSRLRPQSPSRAAIVDFGSSAPVFSRKEKQILYAIVPHIHSTVPELLEESWNNVAARFGHHAPDEWRSLYQTAILPEYMSRNKLETLEDLDDHTHIFLAEEKKLRMLKQEDATEGEESGEETSEEEGSDMFFPEKRNRRHDKFNDADGGDLSGDAFREASPELGLQMILRAIEVKEKGETIAEERHLEQIRSLPPSTIEISATATKKRLFGRRLSSDDEVSQSEDQPYVGDAKPPNDLSLGEHAVTSALVSSTSQPFPLSKRPPESGQRPPESLTMSQEQLVTASTNDQDIDGRVSILDVLAATDKILEDDDDISTAQRAESPTVNLLSDDTVEAANIVPSPVPSDTGSEYMPFDTGPERSQLWDPSQDEIQDDSDDDQKTEVSEYEGFQIIQHATNDTPKMGVQEQPTFTRDLQSPRHMSPSQETDLEENKSQKGDQTEDETDESGDEDKPQPDGKPTAGTKLGSRMETQALFQQSFADGGRDNADFEVPPPEGGWEQFGELEDDSVDTQDAQDIRTSVELPDHELIDRISSVLSMTEEERPELVGKEENPLHGEMVIVSDNESGHTTFSEEVELVDLREVPRKQKPHNRTSSNGSERTASSRVGSSPDTDHDRDDAESSASDDRATIESWFTDQPKLYSNLSSRIVNRLASTSLNATLFNLTAATFTMRDMVKSFEDFEANRRSQFVRETRVKREYTSGTPQPSFKPKTRLTEDEAKAFLPQVVIGVWTVEDDRDFLSRTIKGLERVEKKHGSLGVKKRAKFLKLRYGQEAMVEIATPRSALPVSTRRRA